MRSGLKVSLGALLIASSSNGPSFAQVSAEEHLGALGRLDSALLEDIKPDKKKDTAWTTSSRFKRDLVEMFTDSANETVLELGAHVGYCTRVLSRLFGVVLAVEHSLPVLESNKERNADRSNIVYLNLHTTLDDWAVFVQNRIGVVFIDAAHDYHSVATDIARALAIPSVHTLVLDDYGAEKGVHRAVTEAVAAGHASIRRFVGEAPPWSFSDREVAEWEGVVLSPASRDGSGDNEAVADAVEREMTSRLLNTTWVTFPTGVFNSGYFQPHGMVHLSEPGVGASSYGPLAWRAVSAAEAKVIGAPRVAVLRLEESPYWRAEVKFNRHFTGAVLFRDDGEELVAVRQEMMRVIGDKMLSFLH